MRYRHAQIVIFFNEEQLLAAFISNVFFVRLPATIPRTLNYSMAILMVPVCRPYVVRRIVTDAKTKTSSEEVQPPTDSLQEDRPNADDNLQEDNRLIDSYDSLINV